MKMLCEMAGSILDVNGDLLEYIHLMKRVEYRNIWGKEYGNELGRLAQGIRDNIKGTDTIFFTTKQNIPFEIQRDIPAKYCEIIEKERKSQIEQD